MSREKPDFIQQGGRWLRVGILTLTTAAPALNTLLAWMRQRSQVVSERTSDLQLSAIDARAGALQQLDEFTRASRQRVAEQANYLQLQAQQLSSQATQLRAALRREKQQRKELNRALEQLRAAGIDWSQELLKRGENVMEDLLEQGGKLSTELLERGSEVGQDLAKRSSEIGQNLAERGEQLLQSGRKRKNGTFWTIFGFGAGLLGATTVTYLLIRRRLQRHETEQSQQIELPQNRVLNAAVSTHPAGAIRHIDGNGNAVATLQAVNAQRKVEAPADAAFVGVISTKQYYPLTANTNIEAKDVVFFATEEEAKNEGFAAAATE